MGIIIFGASGAGSTALGKEVAGRLWHWDTIIPLTVTHSPDLAVFISTPAEICAERVRAREYARWGERVLPGGDMYKITRFHGDANDYISNAQRYETAEVSKFGRKLHEQWMAEMLCPVMRVDGTKSISENADCIIKKFLN